MEHHEEAVIITQEIGTIKQHAEAILLLEAQSRTFGLELQESGRWS